MNNSSRINLLQLSIINIVLHRKYESFQEDPIPNFLFDSLESLIPYLYPFYCYLAQTNTLSKHLWFLYRVINDVGTLEPLILRG